MIKNKIFFTLTFSLFLLNTFCSEITWLSGSPPDSEVHKYRPSGMQHYLTFRSKGTEKLILWYRQGTSVMNSVYLNQTLTENPEIFVFGPDKKEKDFQINNNNNCLSITYNFDEEGYHNIYVIERWVQNEILRIHVAKVERMSHKCMNGHKRIREKTKVSYFPQIPFDIIRKRRRLEDLHLRHQSGDFFTFEILLNGKATEHAEVEFITQKGWKKRVISNASGMVSFQLIADYFSKWKEFKKDHSSHFLIKAKYKINKAGTYNDQNYKSIVYTATYADDYIASKTWYQSNVYAFLIIIASLILFILMVYFYRLKFKKPY